MTSPIDKLKLFPLGLILLKGEQTYLHVFEPKYLQLVKECMNNDHIFGIPFIQDGKLTKFGSKVKVKKIVRKYPNGTIDILIEGIVNFTLLNIVEDLDKLYLSGMTESHIHTQKSGLTLSTLFQMYLEKTDEITDNDPQKGYSIEDISVCLQMSLAEKYKFVSSVSFYEKEKFLVNQIRFLLFLSELECKMEYNFSLN